MLIKFSEELRDARIRKGITLQQISARTRIDIKFLEAMDNGDFTFLPDTYVKAFIRDYAKMIGLDESIILKKYEAAKKGKSLEETEQEAITPPVKEETPVKPLKTGNKQPEKPKEPPVPVYSRDEDTDDKVPLLDKRKLYFISILAGGALFLFGLIYLVFFRSSSEIVVVEKPIEEVIQKSKSRFVEEDTADVTAAAQENVSDSVSVVILAKDTCWIRIILDDRKVDEFILFPNSQKALKAADNYKMTLGNSNVISFILNDKPLEFSGRPGGVTYVQIDNSGLQYLRQPPTVIQE